MSMGKIIVTLTDNLERKLRNTVKNKYGNKRGAMSIIVEEALKNYFEKEN
jgi:metal-responsive CopG/Arc/MetJ family transcriptional regulator